MNDKHIEEVAIYVAGWLDKMSVGCFLVAFFQPDHIFGGTVGGIIFFLAGLTIKIMRNAK